MEKVKTPTVAAIATALAFSSGCIFQPQPTVAQGDPYPKPGARVQHERQDASRLTLEATPSTNALDVTLSQPIECRDHTPLVRDVETKRSANLWEQYVNGGSFLVLGGIGLYELAGPCSFTPDATSSNPSPSSQPCTPDQKSGANVAGGVLVGLGALFGAAFIYNVIRAHDSNDTVPVHGQPTWVACDSKPVVDTTVSLIFGDGQRLSRDTDSKGHARFDLTPIRWIDELLRPGTATLVVDNTAARSNVSLAGIPAYTAWQERVALAAQQDAQAPLQSEQAQQQEAAALQARCGGGQSAACVVYQFLAQCQQDLWEGCDSAGNAYLGGVGGARDVRKAKMYWQRACQISAPRCAGYGVQLLRGGDEHSAFAFFDIGCQADADQCGMIGVILRQGPTAPKGREYLKRGCDAGSARSCQALRSL